MQTTPTVPPMTTLRPPVEEPQEPPGPDPEQPRREQAIKRVQDMNAFKAHLVAYLVTNAMFIVMWALTGWLLLADLCHAGVGRRVAIHGYSVYGGGKMTETQIEREMKRLP